MAESPHDFKGAAAQALADPALQKALLNVKRGFVVKRETARANLPEFDALRDEARAIRDHTLAHLDLYLDIYEQRVTAQGGHVHFAVNGEEARAIVLDICRKAGARTVTKGKSMVSEEIGLNAFLEQNGITPVETDLGEYIIQIRNEAPSHIIAPAIHVTKAQVQEDFRRVHTHLPADRNLDESTTMLTEARGVLREKFLNADVGVTGANFLVAETGTSIIVTNEGNGDLTQTLPKVHVVLATIEKLVPTLEDVAQLFRVLARSATGQEMSVYTTVSTGPRRAGDLDGPEQYHVVLLDNGRSGMLTRPVTRQALACIRCGACLNACPVYRQVGGHAYGSVYAGPIGAVLTPLLRPDDHGARELAEASTLCGACWEACPVRIPLHDLLLELRQRDAVADAGWVRRMGFGAWSWAWSTRPGYAATSAAGRIGRRLARRPAVARRLPGWAGAWGRDRDLP
jgi:L-lactate dehydrogenase complex protein LldF